MKRRTGFTLLEILVVVAILVLLTAIALYAGFGATQSSKRNATMATLKSLDGLRVDYQRESAGKVPADMGAFLSAVQGLPNLETALRAMPSKILVSSGGTVTAVKDAWGNEVKYFKDTSDATFFNASNPFNAGLSGKVPFFVSAGTDQKFATDDDLYSFDP